MRTQEQVNEIVRLLLAEYPQADCTLDWRKDYELLFSVRRRAVHGRAREQDNPRAVRALPDA